MKRHLLLIGLLLPCVFTITAEVKAQEPHGRLTIYGTTSETVLKAPALSGQPRFVNDGSYMGLTGELNTGKLSVYAMYQTGRAKLIPGGELFPPATTFQPLTGERSDVIEVAFGYKVFEHPYVGSVDLFAGYYRLWAEPMISPANWYQGPEFGFKGRREAANGMAVTYKVGYVPTYTVNGYVHKSLAEDDIWLFRFAGEVPVHKKLFVTGGWQFMRLEAVATANKTPAVVTFGGFFLGGGYRF